MFIAAILLLMLLVGFRLGYLFGFDSGYAQGVRDESNMNARKGL